MSQARSEIAYERLAPKRYRKDGALIDAVQLTPQNGPEVWEWSDSKPLVHGGETHGLRVFAPTGHERALFGDYVIRNVQSGAFRVVTADWFGAWEQDATPVEEG